VYVLINKHYKSLKYIKSILLLLLWFLFIITINDSNNKKSIVKYISTIFKSKQN